jgi:hypothetical protein
VQESAFVSLLVGLVAALPVVHVTAGTYHFEVTGMFKPPVVQEVEDPESQPQSRARPDSGLVEKDIEADVVKDDLVHRFLSGVEDHCSHSGGGHDPVALVNGTTRNGSGGTRTMDAGKTFRGYGQGDWLVVRLKQPCDLSEIRTFAGHGDARASQDYEVLVAYAANPEKFAKLVAGSKPSAGAASELRIPVKAEGVIAVRFEFRSGPHGFNVYREVNLLGTPSLKR